VALITGGGSGVGLATAKLFLAERAKVAICGRTTSKIQAAAETLDGGANLFATACDVAVPDKVAALVRAGTGQSGDIDILVDNAAKFGMSALGICVGAEEKDNGIRVCNIYPGEIDTPILEHRPTPVSDAQRKQILRAEDVADAVMFVAALPARASVPELVIKPT